MRRIYVLLICLLLPIILAYPHSHSNVFDHFMKKYLQERSDSVGHFGLDRESLARRQMMYPLLPTHQHQPQIQPICLPHIWTCGPGLPPCCAGLMCYDGNAKRGRHCVARG